MVSTTLSAQVYYKCDFEDPAQAASWHLNYAIDPNVSACTATQLKGDTTNVNKIPNHWYIGEIGDFSPELGNGLYISADSGATSSYNTAAATHVIAYDTLTLAPGTYALDFDWRLAGNASTKLYVAWVPRDEAKIQSLANAASANWFKSTYRINTTDLFGQRTWKPETFTFQVTQATSRGKLIFVFTAAQDYGVMNPPAACVDNIEIHSAASCAPPTQLKYTDNTASLTWSGRAAYYQVRDYSSYAEALDVYDSLTVTSLKPNLYAEGMHTFYVRALCDEGQYSPWVTTTQFVWIPGVRCLDYMDLSNPAVAACYTGTANATSGGWGSPGGYNAYATLLNGPNQGRAGDWNSGQHTWHTNPDEFDPQTEGLLPTVPEGELMSIRLGNMQTSNGAEGIVYRLTIPRGESKILKLKYALVLNYASGHDAGGPEIGEHGGGEQSHFYVEIRDNQGRPQGAGCSTFDFSATPDISQLGPGWHIAPNDVIWKEWTEVSISLVEFAGQTIQIRLSNYDCTAGGHWGYAYFAMECIDGGLQGIACGDFSTDHFEAPEGFNYRWYARDDAQKRTLSTDRVFNISPQCDTVFLVDVINKVNGCSYTLTANPNPRFPKAVGTHSIVSANCRHDVTFTNNSFVRVVNRKDGSTMSQDELITKVILDYGDGVKQRVSGDRFVHTYPATGGHYDVYMVASMNDDVCTDTIRYSLDLPDLLHTGSDRSIHLCNGQTYTMSDGTVISTNRVDSTVSLNKYGCMAPDYTRIYFHDVLRDTTVGHICEGGYFEFEGKKYTQPIFDSAEYISVWKCDSVHYLKLSMTDLLKVEMPQTFTVCGDDRVLNMPYRVLGGDMDSVTVVTSSIMQDAGFEAEYTFAVGEEIVIPMPEGVIPGAFDVSLHWHTPECPVEPIRTSVNVLYPSTIFDQVPGVVSLQNEMYNGGEYEWTAYQWYRNGVLMPNDTMSYVIVDPIADIDAEYTVVVTRQGDRVTIGSCPFIYSAGLGIEQTGFEALVRPTLVQPGEQLVARLDAPAAIYDVMGRLVFQETDWTSGVHTITAPSQPGVYFVKVNQLTTRIIVR